MTINSYPTVYALGHSAIKEIFNGVVIVEEKIDGSQFSFGVIDGELQCRSKGKQLLLDAPEKMFVKAVETARSLEPILEPEWIYRCEYLEKPKHNVSAYDHVPNKHLILFDVQYGMELYLTPGQKVATAAYLGIDVVPMLADGHIESLEIFNELLDTISILGGTKVEGLVVKNYSLFTPEKKVAIGKYVSEKFKEVHDADWKLRNPGAKDFVLALADKYRSTARWQKAVQHLREQGIAEGSPRDIGTLIREIPEDILREDGEEIKRALFEHFWPDIRRAVTRGFPEWYKQELAKQAFEQ